MDSTHWFLAAGSGFKAWTSESNVLGCGLQADWNLENECIFSTRWVLTLQHIPPCVPHPRKACPAVHFLPSPFGKRLVGLRGAELESNVSQTLLKKTSEFMGQGCRV